MKREKILFFLEKNKVSLYFVNSNREKLIDIDTSLFFKFGEISNVELCEEAITEILAKMSLGPYYLKPNIIILYNDVCNSDIKFLYRCALRGFNYNALKFISFKDVTKKIKEGKNVVVYSSDCYTLIERGEKCMDESTIDFEPIVIGKYNSIHIHFSDENILWKTFKTHFTNDRTYDMIDVGDDE